ncbi:hypothetical protein Patl1_11826 [Pistacia atlantica]|uniref:Uncharacterized protein n=1 Tax=Pistacia atlantica TaxID=434234 RepID=A0ACC1A4N8_9ROSI|nr:hypothetical protein Patl1_11826 [Pistacia atlantica]
MEGERVDSSLGFINLRPNNGDESSAVNLSGQVHQLPCCIKYDGIEIDGLKVEEAHFRGRKLQGVTISLPDGYSVSVFVVLQLFLIWGSSFKNGQFLGFVLGNKSTGKRKVSDTSEENSTCWETNARFDKLTILES